MSIASALSAGALVALIQFHEPISAGMQAPDLVAIETIRASVAVDDRLSVKDNQQRVISGVLVGVSETALQLRTKHGLRDIPMRDIVHMKGKGDSPWDDTVKGVVIGGLAGLAVVSMYCSDGEGLCVDLRRPALRIGAVYGGALGLVTDLVHQGWRTIYRAQKRTERRVSMGFSPAGVHARVALRF